MKEISGNRERAISIASGNVKFNPKKIQSSMEKMLNISLDGKIEYIKDFDSLASLARLARLDSFDSLDSLASLDSLDSLDSYYEMFFGVFDKRWSNFLDACENGCFQAIFWFENKVYVLPFPDNFSKDEQNRLHSENKEAVNWLGEKFYYWHSVKVDENTILHPNKITLKDIDNEHNSEVKRVKMERMGIEKYLKLSKAKPIHSDSFGRLFALEGERYYIELVNATKNPDGTDRIYYMQVNPFLYNGDAGKYAQAAVASTWRNPKNTQELIFPNWRDYSPDYAS